MTQHLESAIEAAWEARAELSPSSTGEARDAVMEALDLLDFLSGLTFKDVAA